MKTGLILSRKSDLYSVTRFAEEAPRLGCDLIVRSPESVLELSASGRCFSADFILPRFGTYNLENSLAALKQLEQHGIFTLNGSEGIALSKDKLWQFLWLQKNHFPTPKTRSLKDGIGSLNFPIVLKPRVGSKGEGIRLIRSQFEFSQLASFTPEDWLIQEFIAESSHEDLRVLVLNNEILGAHLRRSVSYDFRSNLSLGGQAVLTETTAAERELVLAVAAKIPSLKLIGFDLLRSSRGPLVLEMNSSPGFQGLESLGFCNVAFSILSGCLKK